ncbi:MAG: hypothetical protein IJ480_00715 [Clostridia bacterium]|nr:hypothetical protein [Clostridia bacterium]
MKRHSITASLHTGQVWYYPMRLLRRRPVTICSGAAVLFCLFSLVTLSLLLAESAYLDAIASGGSGQHYGVLYRLNRRQVLTLQDMAPDLEAECTVIPVYAWLEDIETEESLAGVVPLTAEIVEWYALDSTDGSLPDTGEILLPPQIAAVEPYYRLGQDCSFFFHGEDPLGERTGMSVTRRLLYSGTASANDTDLPYVFVSVDTARDILSAVGGDILYDVYFTTPLPSDYAAALVIDALLPALDWPAGDGDPREESGVLQRRYTSESRRIRYRDFINYELLDLLNREYMDDPLFFFTILPVILAAALGCAGILRDETENHIGEYGLLKASGAGTGVLYGSLYAEAALMLGLAVVPVLGSTLAIAAPYLRHTEEMLAAQGISYRYGLPLGNLVTVLLYILLLTCLFLWLQTRRLFSGVPAALLRRTPADDTPEVRISAWQALNAADPVRYMVKTLFRRERRRRMHSAFTQSFLMGVCGYMLVLLSAGGGMEGLYAAYLYGAYILLVVLSAFQELRRNRREYALLRQWGTSDKTIWRRVRWVQFYAALQGMGVTLCLFAALFCLPPWFMSGWIFQGSPLALFLLSYEYQSGVIFSCLAAFLLQLGNIVIGQLAMIVPIRRMLRRSILDDLRHEE